MIDLGADPLSPVSPEVSVASAWQFGTQAAPAVGVFST